MNCPRCAASLVYGWWCGKCLATATQADSMKSREERDEARIKQIHEAFRTSPTDLLKILGVPLALAALILLLKVFGS